MKSTNIIETWKDSFKLLFAWSELKPLTIDIFNNFGQALKLTVKYFWWLMALCFTLPVFALQDSSYHSAATPLNFFDSIKAFFLQKAFPGAINDGFALGFLVVCVLLFFTFFLSTRASSEEKKFSYYLHHFSRIFRFVFVFLPKIFCFFCVLFFLIVFFILVQIAFMSLLQMIFIGHIDNQSTTYILGTAFSIVQVLSIDFGALLIFAGFAFFDREKKACRKAFRLIMYFLPLMIAVDTLYRIILFALSSIKSFLLSVTTTMPFLTMGINISVYFIEYVVIELLLFACYATIYYKIKNTYPDFLEYNERKLT